MMNKIINFKSIFAVTAIAASAMIFSACQKENITATGAPKGKKVTMNSVQQRRVEAMAAAIPTVRLYDQNNGRFMDIDIFNRKVTRDWTFANPTEGYDYAASGTWTNADGSQMVVLTISGTSSGAGGGGTVVAGSSTLDIDYAFCFNVDVEAVGIDLFSGLGGDFEGFAGVVGIAGDFEALANDELGEDPDFEDFFQGFAQYVVYDDYADGNYEVLNWFSDLEEDPDDLADGAFSFVIDFQNLGIYFSNDGSIDVSGASMNFSGSYLALGEFLLELGEEEEEPEVEEVFGYGEMGCN